MGELLLCNEAIAAMPYYIEGVSINVYSIEAVSYTHLTLPTNSRV